MFGIQPRIFHKGLVLLVVPLVFELIVATTLIFLQHYYGEAVKAETLRKQIVFHINKFWRWNTAMTLNPLQSVLLEGNPVTPTSRFAPVAQIETLSEKQISLLQDIMTRHEQMRALWYELKMPQSSSGGPIDRLFSLTKSLRAYEQLITAKTEVGGLIRSFKDEHDRDHARIEYLDRTGRSPEQRCFEEFNRLKTLVAQDNPPQTMRLQDMMDCHMRIRALCEKLNSTWSTSASPMSQVLSLTKNLSASKRLLAANLESGDLIRSFRKYELLRSAKATEKVQSIASLIQLVLAGAIAGSAVIAYVLFRYFMRGIHRGVQALTLNIQRFKRGQELAPQIDGSDEIALLDERFHEMAEEVALAQRMKQAFLTTMSQEIKVPIDAAKEYLAKLSSGSLGAVPEEAVARVQRVEQTMGRLIGLMNDWLALQSPGKISIEILPRMCSLREVIQMSIDSVSTLAEAKGIYLVSSDDEALVYADPDRIVQVLVNLLSNAIKFSPGGSSVVVSANPVDDWMEVRVKDSGRGVPAHKRDAVFQRFEQVTATDATEKGGTGLGLPICKDIVELHGGGIGVESEEGKGSNFWFLLPTSPVARTETTSGSGCAPARRQKRTKFRIVPRTIHAQGLILISVPLLMELAFAITMFSVQRYYEVRLDKERVAAETLFHANEIWVTCTEFIMLKGQFVLFGGTNAASENAVANFKEECRLLGNLVANNPLQRQYFHEIESALSTILSLTDQLRPVASGVRMEKMQILMSDLNILARVHQLVPPSFMEFEISNFGVPPFLESDAAATEVAKATPLIDLIVLGSLVGSTLVAILLFAYFISGINKGVSALVENTDRFRRGEALEPPIRGADELVRVDEAFHDMADEINEAQRTKQSVMAMISHDVRTPLASVLGYFALLSAGGLQMTSKAAISGAQKHEQEIEQLMRLITDLLDLEKLEAGKLTLCPGTVPVKHVMERAITSVVSLADEKGVTVQAGESSAEIYADSDRIVQVLSNLLSSEIRLSPEGACIAASAAQYDGEVEIRVTSSAASTREDLLSSQFDRYQKREYGLKLELPVSSEIVKLHGGTIGAISDQHGCTLWFRLPCGHPQ